MKQNTGYLIQYVLEHSQIYHNTVVTLLSFLTVEASGICRLSNRSDKINIISGFSGTFFTPDYPVPYPNDARCNWIITVPAGKRVKLEFEDFDFGPVSSSCKNASMRKTMFRLAVDWSQEKTRLLFIVDTPRLVL